MGDGALREQTLGNLSAVIAHRQNVPESAELIAEMAGTKPVWITTQQTDDGLLGTGPSGRGTRRRGYEFEIQPTRIKPLRRSLDGRRLVGRSPHQPGEITYVAGYRLEVPRVVGFSPSDARHTLALAYPTARLQPGTQSQPRVIAQHPAAGSRLKPFSVVRLWASRH